jgi:hypothetical protein
LAEHLKDFASHLTNKGSTADHVKLTKQRAEWIISRCKFQRITDINAERVQDALAQLRAEVLPPATTIYGRSRCSSAGWCEIAVWALIVWPTCPC